MASAKRTYLDYAATTPVDPRVLKAMRPYFAAEFGNPGSLHSYGQKALAAVDGAREMIANALDAKFREIIFTGSATEANNLALRGALEGARFEVRGSSRNGNKKLASRISHLAPRIIVSAIEHESVLETARDLEKSGSEVVYLPVDKKGIVDIEALRKALTETTVLVSIMYVNNETGAVQPISEIARVIRDFRENLDSRLRGNDRSRTSHLAPRTYPLFHTDAAQALAYFDCRPNKLGVDLMTLSAHKIYGPKGAGVLYTKLPGARLKLAPRTSHLAPILTGGGQEYGFRSGTENVPAIAGFAKAMDLAVKEREKNENYVSALRARFLKALDPRSSILNSPANASPHIVNLWIKGRKAEDVLTKLDLQGIAISSGSACRSRSFEPSHVLQAMRLPEKRIRESIRVSFGSITTTKEVDRLLTALRAS